MNPFTTLGLAETATPGEVKKAYRALLLRVHPDVVGEAGHEATVDLIVAYQQALDVAQANAGRVAEQAPPTGFVPARHRTHGAWIRKDAGFVASTFHAFA